MTNYGKTKAGSERKRPAREAEGRPTKYSQELAEQIALELTHNTIKKTCIKFDITPECYYEWLYKYPEFSDLSTKSRKTKAVHHFTACEEILEEMAGEKSNESYRADMARVRLDFHLRLAGKANQGLFGDAKNNIAITVDNKDVDVPARVTQEEWLKDK